MFSTIGYYICIPFAALLRIFYNLTGSYGLSLIFFTLVIKLVLLPFQMKSKKSMVRMNRMSGKMQEIQKKYANNQMKMQEEMQKFYTEEGINPMSGCLWSFLPMPIMIALYYIIREPIVFFMNFGSRAANQEMLQKAKDLVTALGQSWSTLSNGADGAYSQIEIIQHISNNVDNPLVKTFLADNPRWVNVDYHFLGLDLTTLPSSAFGQLRSGGATAALIGVLLIPILSGALSFLLSKVSMAGSSNQGSAAATNKTMMLMMPLMSVYIAFIMPAALGVYWIAQSAFSIIQEFILGRFYMRKIQAEEDARFQAREADRKRRQEEAKVLQEQRQRQSPQKKSLKEKRQEAQEAKNKAKKPSTTEAGRVGERPYARGRSYRADRYDTEE